MKPKYRNNPKPGIAADPLTANAPVKLKEAISLHQKGQLSQAKAIYEGLLKAQPNHHELLHLLGIIAFQTKDYQRAADLIGKAIDINPGNAEFYSNRGMALKEINRLDEAAASYDRAISLRPDFAEAHNNRGIVLKELERFDEAVASYDRAISLRPDFAEAYSNRGNALRELSQFAAAVESYDRAIRLKPDHAVAYNNRGMALKDLKRLDEAFESFDRAISLKPNYALACYNKSSALLLGGKFADGWKQYLERPTTKNQGLLFYRQLLSADLAGARILLVKDQGLGDEIFFLRFAPELKRRGALLTYRASGKIVPMLGRLSFLDTVIDEDALAPPSDIVISVGDLPFLLGMKTTRDIPPSLSLPILTDRLAVQRAMLADLGSPPYIGVTWRAGTDRSGSLFKSVPINEIGEVLRFVGGTLVALQRAPEIGEIDALSAASGAPVHDLSALNDRLEDMLALLSLLDDYVTVSNTNVHLRAAVGRGSRVLVPSPPEFRWMIDGTVSPWYPNCKVYRQEIGGSWDTALADLASDLSASGTAQQGVKH